MWKKQQCNIMEIKNGEMSRGPTVATAVGRLTRIND